MTRASRGLGLLLAALASGGCSVAPSSDADPSITDNEAELGTGRRLRMNEIQMKATHNSYHVARPIFAGDLDYTFAELDVQLAEQGVRSLELDLHLEGGAFRVYHAWNDWRTRCRDFVTCLADIERWSSAHPTHHPLIVLLEAKQSFGDVDANAYYARLETEILSRFPRERLVTPGLVQEDAPTLRDAVTTRGWPAIDEVRGRVMFVLTASAEHRAFYAHGGKDLSGRLVFVAGDGSEPYASVRIMDDPKADRALIEAAVRAGFIVRTRADSGMTEWRANDRSRLDVALASGAQIVSTDFPVRTKGREYVVAIPGGAPSRCNPLVAPAGCTALAVESLR